jgi:hypothetical protein
MLLALPVVQVSVKVSDCSDSSQQQQWQQQAVLGCTGQLSVFRHLSISPLSSLCFFAASCTCFCCAAAVSSA